MPTTHYGYYYPDASTSLTPLATVLAAMAASSDAAYKKTPAVFDTIAARDAAITTPTDGRIVYTKDYDILWHYAGGWRPVGVPTFPDVTARDAAITAPVAGMRCFVGSGATMAEYVHDGTAWKLWLSGPVNVTVTASGWTAVGWGGFTVAKTGGIVTMSLGAAGTAKTTNFQVGVLPVGYRPARDIVVPASIQGWATTVYLTIVASTGVVTSVGSVSRTELYAAVSFWAGT